MLATTEQSSLQRCVDLANRFPDRQHVVALLRCTRSCLVNAKPVIELDGLQKLAPPASFWDEQLEKSVASLFRQQDHAALAIILKQVLAVINLQRACSIVLDWLDVHRADDAKIDAEILGNAILHIIDLEARVGTTINSKLLMSVNGGKPLFELLRVVSRSSVFSKAALKSLLLYQQPSERYWQLWFRVGLCSSLWRELLAVPIRLPSFLASLKVCIEASFACFWSEQLMGCWLLPILLQFVDCLKPLLGIADFDLRDAFLECLGALFFRRRMLLNGEYDLDDTLWLAMTDREARQAADRMLVSFIADKLYASINSLWHGSLPAPSELAAAALAGCIEGMHFHGMLKQPLTLRSSWLLGSTPGLCAYAAVVDLWSRLPSSVCPQDELSVARICLRPELASLMSGTSATAWTHVGIPMLSKLFRSHFSQAHFELLFLLPQIDYQALRSLAGLISMHDVGATIDIFLHHFHTSPFANALRDMLAHVMNTSTADQAKLAMRIVWTLRGNSEALLFLLSETPTVVLAWAVHMCTDGLQAAVAASIPRFVQTEFAPAALLLLHLVRCNLAPASLESSLQFAALRILREAEEAIGRHISELRLLVQPAGFKWHPSTWISSKSLARYTHREEMSAFGDLHPPIEVLLFKLLAAMLVHAIGGRDYVESVLRALSRRLDGDAAYGLYLRSLAASSGLAWHCLDERHPLIRLG